MERKQPNTPPPASPLPQGLWPGAGQPLPTCWGPCPPLLHPHPLLNTSLGFSPALRTVLNP